MDYPLTDMKERYDKYTENYESVWADRFVWNGLNGNMPNHMTSIPKYFKDSLFVSDIPVCRNAKKFHELVTGIADDYVLWCNSKDIYTEEENISQRNFFLGTIGEYFFCNMINDLHRILIPHKYTGDFEIYEFNNIAPRFADEGDFGVDLTGTISYRNQSSNCAIQVKFWNPNSANAFMSNAIASGVASDALCNNFISQYEDKNIILCWLGNMSKVSLHLQNNAYLYKHIIFIDGKVLDANINNQNPKFWERMRDKLYDIKNYE